MALSILIEIFIVMFFDVKELISLIDTSLIMSVDSISNRLIKS
jgi:hypothetical protein